MLRAIIFLISQDDLSNSLLTLLFWTCQLPLLYPLFQLILFSSMQL